MKTHNILGIRFSLLSYADVMRMIARWRHRQERHYVTLTPPYSVLLCRRDTRLYEATRAASLTLPDGVGIILAARLLRYPHCGRVTGPTLMLKLCDWGRTQGLRHFFYGGALGVAEALVERLKQNYPGLEVAGIHCPPFRELTPGEDAEVVRRINETRPDVVWVALGSPKQEKWMMKHVGKIDAAALIGVGAAFDFRSGRVKWAPAWMRNLGVEWAYRLAQEPRRMWRRNVNSFVFLGGVVRQRVGGMAARGFAETRRIALAGRRPFRPPAVVPHAGPEVSPVTHHGSQHRQITAAALAAGLLLGLCGVMYRAVAAPVNRAPLDAAALVGFPRAIGDWTGADMPIEAAVRDRIDADSYISRRYSRQPDGASVSLYLPCSTNVPELLQHIPENCYVGAGWVLAGRHSLELPLPAGGKLPCSLLRFARNGWDARKLVLLHFLVADGEYFTTFSAVAKAKGWRHFATLDYAAQVQIVAAADDSTTDEAARLVTDFALDTAPVIGQLLENLPQTRGAREPGEPLGVPQDGTNHAQPASAPPRYPAP